MVGDAGSPRISASRAASISAMPIQPRPPGSQGPCQHPGRLQKRTSGRVANQASGMVASGSRAAGTVAAPMTPRARISAPGARHRTRPDRSPRARSPRCARQAVSPPRRGRRARFTSQAVVPPEPGADVDRSLVDHVAQWRLAHEPAPAAAGAKEQDGAAGRRHKQRARGRRGGTVPQPSGSRPRTHGASSGRSRVINRP